MEVAVFKFCDIISSHTDRIVRYSLWVSTIVIEYLVNCEGISAVLMPVYYPVICGFLHKRPINTVNKTIYELDMKIQEITEGYTDESWATGAMDAARGAAGAVGRGAAAVGRAAGKAGGAVAGAAGRQMRDVGNTAMAKMGFGKAQGAKELQRVTGGVIKNFNRYLGQINSKPTVGALKQYLTALGFQNPVVEVAKGAMAGQARQGFDPSKRGAQQPKAQAPATQAPATGGRKDTDVLTRNDLFDIIGKNIQQALKSGTLPKELKKFLGQ